MHSEAVVVVSALAVLYLATASEDTQSDKVAASLSCPPGFTPDGNSSQCICADWPDGIVKCDEDSLQASMQLGFCMTYDNETHDVRVGACQVSFYRSDFFKFYFPLPKEAADLDQHVCGPSNSRGLLCGECQDGYSVSPLLTLGCNKCSGTAYSWLKLIAFQYIPITIFLVAIVLFAISIVSAPMNAFIFFSQITTGGYVNVAFVGTILSAQGNLTTLYRTPTVINVVSGFYNVWNLNFFNNIIPPFCVSEHLTKLQSFELEYAKVIYPLLLIIMLYVGISSHGRNFRPLVYCWKPFHKYFVYFRRSIDSRTSVIDAFATFLLLSYVKLLAITTPLFQPTYHYNGEAQKLDTMGLHYSPTVQAFHGSHLLLAVIAISALLIFVTVPPLVLILYPTSPFQKCLTRCRIKSQALRTFTESFNGCFKDGTNGTRDYRYFAGVYFLLRVVYILSLVLNTQYYIMVLALFYLVTAVLFALVQPYKRCIYNVIDAIMFCILAIIHMLIIAHATLILFFGLPSTLLSLISGLLYSLPLFYFLLFCAIRLLNRKTGCTQKLRKHKWMKYFFDCKESDMEQFDATVPHRIQHPEEYQ